MQIFNIVCFFVLFILCILPSSTIVFANEHLVPSPDILSDFSSRVIYYNKIRDIFEHNQNNGYFKAKFICFPPFAPEWEIVIMENNKIVYIEAVTSIFHSNFKNVEVKKNIRIYL
jgi:hypothetical protein